MASLLILNTLVEPHQQPGSGTLWNTCPAITRSWSQVVEMIQWAPQTPRHSWTTSFFSFSTRKFGWVWSTRWWATPWPTLVITAWPWWVIMSHTRSVLFSEAFRTRSLVNLLITSSPASAMKPSLSRLTSGRRANLSLKRWIRGDRASDHRKDSQPSRC